MTTPLHIPAEDLTCHNFSTRDDLTDRQYFAWALQTETRIRFQKLEARKAGNLDEEATLESDYLVNVYPSQKAREPVPEVGAGTASERDHRNFERKANPLLKISKEADGSLDIIEVTGYDRFESSLPSALSDDALPVPPNFLYFEICLESYMGYSPDGIFQPKHPTMPSGAIMGGAVVAALSAWRDPNIRDMFDDHILDLLLPTRSDATPRRRAALNDRYIIEKERLIKTLHEYFLYKDDAACSSFSDGDVDIFLQASTLTTSVFHSDRICSLDRDSLTHIQDFIGGLGWCHEEFQRYSTSLLNELQSKHNIDGKFVHVLTKNSLSFMFARNDPRNVWDLDEQEEAQAEPNEGEIARLRDELFRLNLNRLRLDAIGDRLTEAVSHLSVLQGLAPRKRWPRPTQLIMLDPRADLLGALMDFDISVVSCAFDGTSVRITPRAALSLTRKVAVVTPFCFEEKRNRKRIAKYYRRGFDTIVLDPNRQYSERQNDVKYGLCRYEIDQTGDLCRSIPYLLDVSDEDIDSFYERQNQSIRDGLKLHYCCCLKDVVDPLEGIGVGDLPNDINSLELFEDSADHATEFFAKDNSWTRADLLEVLQIPNHMRVACRSCRIRYGGFLFLEGEAQVETKEDILRLEKAFGFQTNTGGDTIAPSFYGGVVFNSKLVRGKARNYSVARSLLCAQSNAERLRYIIRNGTVEGYNRRFTYTPSTYFGDDDPFVHVRDDPLAHVFAEAAHLVFPSLGRPPIGLNPERFLAHCQECGDWLHRAKFGTKYCEKCENSKLSAS